MNGRPAEWYLPARLDLIKVVASDGRASCREFAREMLVEGRKWLEEQGYLGTLTNPEKLRNARFTA